MTVPERVAKVRRAEELLHGLEQDKHVTRGQLGRARDLLITVRNRADDGEVHIALQELEDLVDQLTNGPVNGLAEIDVDE